MTRRTERLASVIQEEVTTLLMTGRLKDPRIHEMTTITGAKVSRDLSIATVYYTVLGEEKDVEVTARGLEAARGFIQRHLAKNMNVRVVPSLRFEYDPSIVHGARIEELLSALPELREPKAEEKADDGEDELDSDERPV